MDLQNNPAANRLIVYMMKHYLKIWVLLAAFIYPVFSGFAATCPDLDIQVKDELVSINVKNQPLRCILDQLSRKTGIDMKLWQDNKKRLTLNLRQLSLEDFFHRIGAGNALVYTYLPEQNKYCIIAANIVQSRIPSPEKSNNKQTPTLPGHNSKKDVRPGELLIKFKDSVSLDQMQKLHLFLDSRVLKRIEPLNLHQVKFDPALTLDQAIRMYEATGLITTAEPHVIRTTQANIPNDPEFPRQWGLTAIKANDAWDISQGHEDLVIAVIDTGVDHLHPDLQQNIWTNPAEIGGQTGYDDDGNGYIDDIYGWDFAGNDMNGDNLPFDEKSSHGTHVAGIIGAATNNSIGVAGVCPKVKLMVLKVQKDGAADMENVAILEAIDYAMTMGANIINASFGGGDNSSLEYNAFEQFQNSNNGLIICAAGNKSVNTDITPLYPAGYDLPGIISVAASAKTSTGKYSLAGFSNFGAASVDVMAPGDTIYSTIPVTRIPEAHVAIGSGPTQYPAQGMTFAARTDANGITGLLVDCGYGYTDEIPLSVENNIALIQRGNRDGTGFFFFQKVTNVMQLGAAGAIIYDNGPDNLGGTLMVEGDWIPVIFVSQETGAALKPHNLTPVTLVNRILEDTTIYGQISGTSMAAAFVSGAMGLLRARVPEQTFTRLKEILFDTVDIMDSTQGKLLANGQINIFNAFTSLALPGDVNKDFKLTLEDNIFGLKILTGESTDAVSQDIFHWDVNQDTRLHLPESIHVLQEKTD